jgi:hypothetical protein
MLAACGTLPDAPVFSTQDPECTDDGGGGDPISFANWDRGGVAFATLPFAAAIAPPIQGDGSSVFHLTSTIPIKIRVIGCVPDADVNSLSPTFALVRVGEDASTTPVTSLESSSAVDEGNTLRNAGNGQYGQYLFNFSTKRSGFDAGNGLTPGLYRLTVSAGGTFADVVVQFRLR